MRSRYLFHHPQRSISTSYPAIIGRLAISVAVLPPIVEKIVVSIRLARNPLFSRPGDETADRFIPQQLLSRRESLRERECVVCSVYGAVAGTTNIDCAVQHGVGVPFLPIALVRAPETMQLTSAGAEWGASATQW